MPRTTSNRSDMTDREEKRVRRQLRELLKIFEFEESELQELVALYGYYQKTYPIESYDSWFVEWLVNNWDTVRRLILRKRTKK